MTAGGPLAGLPSSSRRDGSMDRGKKCNLSPGRVANFQAGRDPFSEALLTVSRRGSTTIAAPLAAPAAAEPQVRQGSREAGKQGSRAAAKQKRNSEREKEMQGKRERLRGRKS